MNFDMGAILGAKKAWNTFRANHPRFPDFLSAVNAKGIPEGAEITIIVSYPDGDVKKAGIRVRDTDLELVDTVKTLLG